MRRLILPLVFSVAAFLESRCIAKDQPFDSIANIFEKRCVGCHNAIEPKGGFSLETNDTFLAGGESGEVIAIGRPNESLLVELISGDEPEMPKGKEKLSPNEVELVRQWIESGAPWPIDRRLVDQSLVDNDWWSLKSLTHVELPTIDHRSDRNPIDRFVQAKLRERGLEPAPPADRGTLIRRLSFDLTGLPPTSDEVDAFCADNDLHAYLESRRSFAC